MKKTISFEKKIEFPSMIGEISSISLEHNLQFIDCNNVEGEFIVSGTYKLTEASRIEESFTYNLPAEIILTECLELETCKIDIDDFYYEIEKENILVCHIDLKIEGVEIIEIEDESEERELPKLDKEEPIKLEVKETTPQVELQDHPRKIEKIEVEEENLVRECDDEQEERECDGELTEESLKEENINIKEEMEKNETMETTKETNVTSLFENINESEETYSTYSVYILREEETINTLIEKYKTTKEELENYNDLTNLTIGSKIIIPCHDE